MRRRPLALVVLAGLVATAAAGCGGDGDGDDEDAGDRARRATSTTTASTTTSSTVVGDSGAGPPTTTSAAGGSTTTVTTTPPPTRGAPLESGSVRPTRSGTYTFDNVGTTKLRTCFTYDYPTPASSTLKVDPPNGNRQQAVLANDDATTTTVLEYQEGGIHLAFLRQEQPTPSGDFVTEFEPVPPVLAVPASPAVGQAWSFTLVSKDGQVTTETTRRIEAVDDRVTLGDGRTMAAVRIRTDARIQGESPFGPLDLRLVSVSHQSGELRLLLRDVTDTTGKVGLCDYDSHVESTLRSSTPA
jgi:hypothetical protein